MKTVVVYMNAKASGTDICYWERNLREAFFRYNLIIRKTQTVDELNSYIDRDLNNGLDMAILVGGDGTVHSMIQKFENKDVKLFIIPTGTANDLAAELGLKCHYKKLINIYKNGQTKKIDLIKVNGELMASNGGVGLAQTVASRVNDYRNKFSLFQNAMKYTKSHIYSAVLLRELLMTKVEKHRVFLESEHLPFVNDVISTRLLTVNNQSTIGGQFKIAPKTLNDDGLFNVTIFIHEKKVDFVKALYKMYMGEDLSKDPNVISFETDKLVINSLSQKHLTFFGDGEVFKPASILNIEIEPRSIELYTQDPSQAIFNSYNLSEVGLV